MNIVVMGGRGLVGRNIVERLRRQGHAVSAASRASGVDLITGRGLAESLVGADVVVDVMAPNAAAVSLFAEGPTPDWALPVPKLDGRGPDGVMHFRFALDGLPPGVKAEGAAIKLTLVGDHRAYEFNVNLK